MRRTAILPALALAAHLSAAAPGLAAERLVADLSSREIAITTGFAGTELLLFGAMAGKGDIVVVVYGPRRHEVVRRKERIAGVWVNRDSMSFDDVPAYYHVAATRPLDAIARPSILASREIGAERLKILAETGAPAPKAALFRAALLRNKRRAGLYGLKVAKIHVLGGRLFRTTVIFPANVVTGVYAVDVYLFRNGRVIDKQSTPLAVHKVGLEAEIFEFAHQQSALYGVIAIAIALMAGWLAGVVFRKT